MASSEMISKISVGISCDAASEFEEVQKAGLVIVVVAKFALRGQGEGGLSMVVWRGLNQVDAHHPSL